MADDGPDVSSGERAERRDPLPETRYPAVTDDLDTTFDLLRDARRRYLLYYLFTMDGTVAEFEATVNAVCEYETAGSDADKCAARASVRITLHHTHLPLLASAGVIDYDPRHGTVRFTGSPEIEEWVEHARHKELS